MNTLNLNTKWDGISEAQTQSGFKALRITSECIPDLYIGIDDEGYRCLLLFLPCQIEVKLKNSKKEKLKIDFIKSKNIILVKLINDDFVDLFNDLIISLFFTVKNIADPKEYSQKLIIQYYKWAEFFQDEFNSKLSVEEIIGLWGELFFLKELLEEAKPENSNYILDSWKGPYGRTNDFVFDDKNIEVKTIEETKTVIKISSEFQLEQENNKGLELHVITLNANLIDGASLNDLIKRIVSLIRQKLGDLSFFYKALIQKNLTVDNSKQYDNYRFKILHSVRFDCTIEEFPKLSKSNIPAEINSLKYKLQIKALKDFIIEEKSY